MTLTAPRRLPGIRFEVQPPAPEDVLPRMDIAGFVGLAASGPVGVPVAVEDAAQFAAIFGADAPLAWDDARGEPVYAYLAPAVRAFFRNGGRRCWVVRVAGAQAVADTFELAAVTGVRLTPAEPHPAVALASALLPAASPGSWADGLRVATTVVAAPLRFEHPDLSARDLTAVLQRGEALVAGDLLRLRFAGDPWTLLVLVDAIGPAPLPSPPPADGARRVRVGWTLGFWQRPAELAAGAEGAVSWVGLDGEDVTAVAMAIDAVAGDGSVRLALGAGAPPPPRAGATVRGEFAGNALAIEVAAVDAAAAGFVVAGTATHTQLATPVAAPVPAPDGIAERLELELRVQGSGRAPAVLARLGFAPAHPRYVGALPDDARRYAASHGFGDAGPAAPARPPQPFPLAGPADAVSCYLPLLDTRRAASPLAALRPAGGARLRDGLETFDPGLFADDELAATSTGRLVATADWRRDQDPDPRPLQGIHALLDNDEVTLVAVPDAVHRGWSPGGAVSATPPAVAEPQPPLDWSRFRACGDRIPAAPRLTLVGDAGSGAFTLSWTATDVDAAVYELQMSTEADFAPAETLQRGPARTIDIRDQPAGFILYFQVRAIAATATSDWSNRLVVRTAPAERWLLDPPRSYAPAALVELQLALLRMCAARGDMLAVLALPEHYRERAAIAHVAALDAASRGMAVAVAAAPGAADGARDPIFGYGALYHPWLHAATPEGPAPLRLAPPDGAAAGVIAARAAGRGAWIAPANEPLRDVVALEPAVDVATRRAMQDAQVNLVRQEPGGFLWLCADTLGDDEAVRPIGVRRLLQTVRRLALRHGNAMAFEPNDDITRRAVRRSFQALLGRMFELGAFAGRTPAEGFRVDTPVGAGDLEAGRLVVELRVAPARALSFITVRLVRSGGGGLQVEGR